MPLTPEYTWAESETAIQLQVPLKGQSISKLDVFATECYLKVSFPPYLLEVDLDGCIDSTQPKARVESGTLVIKARKKEDSTGLWGSLGQLVSRKCNPEVKTRRDESIKEKLKLEQELKERMSRRKHEDERLALRSQMSVEEDERRRIEDMKADEKEKAEAEVYRAFAELAARQNRGEPAATDAQPKNAGDKGQHQQQRNLTPQPRLTCSRDPLGTIHEGVSDEDSPVPLAKAPDNTAASKVGTESSIWEQGSGSSNDEEGEPNDPQEIGIEGGGKVTARATAEAPSDTSTQLSEQRQEQFDAQHKNHETGGNEDETPVSYTPAPRVPVGVVPVGFTTRLFPTPLRESKVADESAWIMKNRKHLHKNHSLVGRLPGADSGSPGDGGGENDLPLGISESDPVWLKGRGDDLYRGGDFLGAVNAYTAALDTDPKAAACLSNRAACYLRLSGIGGTDQGRRYAVACVTDCGAALEILQALPETGPSQARALARRSLAYRELGHYCSSLEDCRAALLFSPGDAALLEEEARGEPLAKAELCKKEAATRFAAGDIHGACEMYTAALEAVPSFPPALSNRAACFLALGRPRECVRDCTAVLDMLSASNTRPATSLFCGGVGSNPRDSPPSSTSIQNQRVAATDNGTKREQVPRSPPTAVAASDLALAPSSCPPAPPPPVGSIPPPGSEKRTKWVLATIMRRARASLQLGNLASALQDYRTADSVCPGNKAVEEDIRELERRTREMETPLKD